MVLLTLLGAAGEALRYDRMLKTNTTKRRVHSLFRQGCILYDLIPTMPEIRLRPPMHALLSDAARPAAVRRRFRAGLINEGSHAEPARSCRITRRSWSLPGAFVASEDGAEKRGVSMAWTRRGQALAAASRFGVR